MDTQELAQILSEEINNATNTELQATMSLALQYYDAEVGEVGEGMSDLVSPDVRDAMESSMAEIMSAFSPDDPIAVFEPQSPDDLEAAALETRAVHNQVFGHNRGSIIIETAIRDAMLQRYGVIKVMATDNAIQLHNVAPENFIWSSDLTTPFLVDARFHAERVFYTRAQLEQMGVSESDSDSVPDNEATDTVTLERYKGITLSPASREDDENIECWYCYLRNNDKGGFDCHLFVNPSTILTSTWVEYPEYACGVTTTRPHRFDGVSIFDKLQQIQTSKTYMLRQLAMQAKLASQSRLAVRDKAVNPDDLVADSLNPVIRTKGLPANEILPLPIQDVTSQLLATLQWMDGIRREDGGASIDMTSPQVQVANQSAHAAERAFSVKEMQTNLMLKTIGDTLIRSLFLLVHAKMRDTIVDTVTVRNEGQYYFASPVKFPQRTDLIIDMGTTLGTKQRRQNALSGIIANQNMALQTGGSGILVTPRNIYNAQLAYAKLVGLSNAEVYWTNPDSPEAQQSAQQQAMASQEAANKEVDAVKEIEKYKGENAQILQHMQNMSKEEIEKLKIEFDYFKATLDAQIEGQKVEVQQAQLILSDMQADVETNREASTSAE